MPSVLFSAGIAALCALPLLLGAAVVRQRRTLGVVGVLFVAAALFTALALAKAPASTAAPSKLLPPLIHVLTPLVVLVELQR